MLHQKDSGYPVSIVRCLLSTVYGYGGRFVARPHNTPHRIGVYVVRMLCVYCVGLCCVLWGLCCAVCVGLCCVLRAGAVCVGRRPQQG
jgi:hypothetical protein